MRLLIIILLGVSIHLSQANSYLSQANHKVESADAIATIADKNPQPVSYILSKRPSHLKFKRNDASALKYLKATMESSRRKPINPRPVGFAQMEPAVVAWFPPPPVSHAVETPGSADSKEGALPKEPSAATENEKPGIPPNADIEEDDEFDPEEDPDDVGDPPIVNGVAVNREE
jgi:hypothetical protein